MAIHVDELRLIPIGDNTFYKKLHNMLHEGYRVPHKKTVRLFLRDYIKLFGTNPINYIIFPNKMRLKAENIYLSSSLSGESGKWKEGGDQWIHVQNQEKKEFYMVLGRPKPK